MKSVATIRQLMFRFTENNEGILKPVCFVIDFAPKKKEKRTLPFFEAHRFFACGCTVLDVLSGLTKRSKARHPLAVLKFGFYHGEKVTVWESYLRRSCVICGRVPQLFASMTRSTSLAGSVKPQSHDVHKKP